MDTKSPEQHEKPFNKISALKQSGSKRAAKKSIFILLGLILAGNTLFAQWTSNGFVIDDPAGPTPPGFTESGNCVTSVGTSNDIGRLYKDGNINLTTTGFSYVFDLNFGTDATIGDGFSFVLMGAKAYGADGGRLGFSNMAADNITFEWDTFVNTAAEGDEAGVPAQHIGISAYNGAASELANELSMGGEIRDGNYHRASVSWVPDGSGGGTFTQTIVNGTTKTLTATLTAAQLAAYDFATSADITINAVTNNVAPQTQSACIVTLPIRLLNFSGRFSDDKIDLAWTSVQEINNKEFNILRSSDGIAWTIIGVVPAADNSAGIMNYSFTDHMPIEGNCIYYMLQQIDYDGNAESFPAIAVKSQAKNVLSIAPNPCKGEFRILFSDMISSEDYDLDIYDMTGKEVYPGISEVSSREILIDGLSGGIYYLRLHDGLSHYVAKVVVE